MDDTLKLLLEQLNKSLDKLERSNHAVEKRLRAVEMKAEGSRLRLAFLATIAGFIGSLVLRLL